MQAYKENLGVYSKKSENISSLVESTDLKCLSSNDRSINACAIGDSAGSFVSFIGAQTAWAGRQDGVLVWDKLGDGIVHDQSQYAFSQYGRAGSTDLQGLAAAFDTNHDGVFNAQDAKFAEFKVWQDANQNGVSDAGEVRNLADWGIASINLSSDGVVRAPAVGVQEAGRSTAQLAEGGQMLVADAAFAFQTVPQLDLAGFVAQAQAESKAQPLPAQASVKLFLYDMIQGATAAELGSTELFAAEGGAPHAPEPQHLGYNLDLLAEHFLQPPPS